MEWDLGLRALCGALRRTLEDGEERRQLGRMGRNCLQPQLPSTAALRQSEDGVFALADERDLRRQADAALQYKGLAQQID